MAVFLFLVYPYVIVSINVRNIGKMKPRISKFKACFMHERAIIHMIGQAEFVGRDGVTVAEVASWMNVTKATARKHLKDMQVRGLVHMMQFPYKNTTIHCYFLTPSSRQEYEQGKLVVSYRYYVQRVLGIII